MPQSVDGKHEIEIAPKGKYTRQLPVVTSPKQVMSHLHKKTHFKSTRELQTYKQSKIDLSDHRVRDMVKDI